MHRPVHHLFYRQSRRPGLGDIFTRDDIIRTVATETATFDAVTAGSVAGRAAELLSSTPFAALLAYGRQHYDFVLIDSPPYPLASDALIMLAHADRVISVIRLNNTRKAAAAEHCRRISAATSQYSIVLNDARSDERRVWILSRGLR